MTAHNPYLDYVRAGLALIPRICGAPDKSAAEQFLTLLDESAATFTFQTFDDLKSRKDRPLAKILHGTIDQHFAELAALNARGAGIFVMVQRSNGHGRANKNVTAVRLVFQEDDGEGKPLPLAPHIVVESSPGKYHRYLLADGLTPEDYRTAQGVIVDEFGSDPNAKDLARVLRLPGFFHLKNPANPWLVRVVEQSTAAPYTRDQILAAFRPRTKPNGKAHSARSAAIEVDAGVLADLRAALFYLSAGPRNLWIGMAHALHELGDPGRSLWLEWSATSDKYVPADSARVWSSIKTSESGYRAVFAAAIDAGWNNSTTGSASSDGVEKWPEPLPIPCSLLPVESFDDELLPISLRGWVTDISNRMQCPPDFPAVGAMVALASVIGRKACIRPKRHDDWQVVPNLWGVIVGRPGVMKSPALAEVLKPLDRLSIIANGLHAEAMRDHEIKLKMDGMTDKATAGKAQNLIKAGKLNEAEQLLIDEAAAEAVTAPPLRRYKVTDSTVEALGEILIENSWGTLAYRDELSGLLRSLDREGQEGARSFYLQGYDGNQSYTFDRIGRGKNLHIPAVCIAMLGGIQPGKIQAYIHDAMSGGIGDDGLLQRFGMLVWPDVCGEWVNVDRWPDTTAKNLAFATFERLDAMLPGTDADTGEPAPVVYHFDQDAQALFDDWRHDFECDLRSSDRHPAFESHLAKYRKLVPAIALVCALAEQEVQVSEHSLLRALAWADYLSSHAARAYAAGTRPVAEGARALLAKIKEGKVAAGFRPADVYLKGWSHISTPEAVHAACAMLCDLHCLRCAEKRPGDAGGRPSITFDIHPLLMVGI